MGVKYLWSRKMEDDEVPKRLPPKKVKHPSTPYPDIYQQAIAFAAEHFGKVVDRRTVKLIIYAFIYGADITTVRTKLDSMIAERIKGPGPERDRDDDDDM
jgi:hypothetical protein